MSCSFTLYSTGHEIIPLRFIFMLCARDFIRTLWIEKRCFVMKGSVMLRDLKIGSGCGLTGVVHVGRDFGSSHRNRLREHTVANIAIWIKTNRLAISCSNRRVREGSQVVRTKQWETILTWWESSSEVMMSALRVLHYKNVLWRDGLTWWNCEGLILYQSCVEFILLLWNQERLDIYTMKRWSMHCILFEKRHGAAASRAAAHGGVAMHLGKTCGGAPKFVTDWVDPPPLWYPLAFRIHHGANVCWADRWQPVQPEPIGYTSSSSPRIAASTCLCFKLG